MQSLNCKCYPLSMKRNVLLYIVNILLFVFSIIVVISGVIKFPGLLPLLNIDPFLLPQAEITFLHDWIGIVLTVLTLVHIILNWKWIQAMSKKLLNRRIVQFVIIFSIVGTAAGIGYISRNQNETSISINQTETSSNEIEEVDLNNLEKTKPIEMNRITIEGLGTFDFNPADISAIRDDVFNKGFFSIFNVLIHLDETGQINCHSPVNMSP